MVSFFGLKLGSKKKSDKGKAAEKATDKTPDRAVTQTGGHKKWDQNLMGEGQFFGTNPGGRSVNGSIRSATMPLPSRPGTASSSRISPYNHNTHNLAASSMYDLSNVSHFRQSSSNSLKPVASDTNLRGSFSNASSSTNLKVPGPGFGSRPGTPGTPGGRTKAWVNPLDVHFGRTTPSAVPSPTPRSPLAQYEFGANDGGDDGSVFGDKAENIAETIMSSVAKKEQEKADKEREEKGKVEREREEREARQKAQEEEKKRDEERQKEHDKQRAAAAAAAIRTPHHGPPGYPPPLNPNGRPNGQMDRPVFQGRHDERPRSRNGRHNSPGPMDRAVFQGQGEHRPGSRNGNRPSPPLGPGPMGRGPFQGQADYRPSSRNGHPDQRPRFQGQMDHQRPGSRNGPQDRPHFQGQMDQRPSSRSGPQDRPMFQGQFDQRPGSRNGPRRDGTPPYGHPPNGQFNGYPPGHMNGRPVNGSSPVNGQGPFRGPPPVNGQRSPNIGHTGHINGHVNSPKGSPLIGATGSPNGVPRSPALNGFPLTNEPQRNGSPMNGAARSSPAPNKILANTNPYFPGDLPSPTLSSSRSSESHDNPALEDQPDKPVIRNVVARRDTITSTTPKRTSVVHAIDNFEKTLATEESLRDSTASSAYSVDEIIDAPAVQPLPPTTSLPTPPYAARPQRSGSAGGRPIPGRNVQRPSPDEYGVPLPNGRTTPRADTPKATTPSPPALSSSPPIAHPSLQPAPLFRQPKWAEPKGDEDFRHDDFSSPRPAPAPIPIPSPPQSQEADNSKSSLDYGATPPTPDPTNPNWPLAPPTLSSPPPSSAPTSSSSPPVSSPPQLKRPNPPPPLNFNFSPDAFSREQSSGASGPFTGGLEVRGVREALSSDTLRPATAGGEEVGVARGLSVRGPAHGLRTPTGIADRFGTPLI